MSEEFEQAALAVVDGDEAGLRRRLSRAPQLVAERGSAPLRPMLLHYCAANGVPDELQRSPANAPEICRLLLGAGADPDGLAASYGGGRRQTPLCLTASSWHPFERGVQVPVIEALLAGGAKIDGLDDDGAPLATSLGFGYTRAAEALARLGARVDNLFFAAGLGDASAAAAWFEAGGELRPGALGTYQAAVPREPCRSSAEIVQEALQFAVTHGRIEVAQLLLARGARANGSVAGHHATLPLVQAVFVSRVEVVPLLLSAGADPDTECSKLGLSARGLAHRRGLDVDALFAG